MLHRILLFVSVIINVIAQILLKTGMNKIGVVNINQSIFEKVKLMLTSQYFWGGIFFYGISFFIYSIVLSKIQLHKAYPVSSISAIVLIFILSVIFLNESIDILKIIGLICCSIGIFLIFR